MRYLRARHTVDRLSGSAAVADAVTEAREDYKISNYGWASAKVWCRGQGARLERPIAEFRAPAMLGCCVLRSRLLYV